MVARPPTARILAYGRKWRWENLKLYSEPGGEYTHDYVSADDAELPAYSVFQRADGMIRHFWRSEGGSATADPGQYPHDAPDTSALWALLDTTPGGRGTDWYLALADEPALNPVRQRGRKSCQHCLIWAARFKTMPRSEWLNAIRLLKCFTIYSC